MKWNKLYLVFLIAFLLSCSNPSVDASELFRSDTFRAAALQEGGSCNPTHRRQFLYSGQTKTHSDWECVAIMAHMVADTASPSFEQVLLERTDGIYPNTSKAFPRTNLGASDAFLAGTMIGAASNISSIPRQSNGGSLCNFRNSYVSGFNRVCQYTCGVDAYATTVPATAMCPIRP